MASIYQRGGVWHIKYFENGERVRKSLKTKSKARAETEKRRIEGRLRDGQPVEHRADIALSEFTIEYLKEIALSKRPHTVKTLAHEWEHFEAWAKAKHVHRLGHVTPRHIADYKRELMTEGYADSSVRSTLTALSSVFRTAIVEMHVLESDNPVKGVGLPRVRRGRAPRYLEQDEIERLLAAAKAHSVDLYLFAALGVYSGLRKNELINATWGWINFNGRGLVNVQEGPGFKPKSGNARSIPLHSKLRAILEPHRSDAKGRYIVYPDKATKKSGTLYRVDITESFETVCKRAGMTDVTPHVLRHTFASQLAIANVSLYKISTWLGHANYATTQIYAHLGNDDAAIDSF
jgi:integrase/recombinase XerC